MGRIDVLHNNVGVSLAGGDAPITEIEADAFARVTTISSIGSIINYPYVAYRTS